MWIHGDRTLAFAAAFAAICGHVFPVWLGFRGGKGVATGLGSFLLLAPKAVLLTILVFVLLLAAFRWVALASVIASASLPPIAWALGETRNLASTAGGVIDRSEPIAWLTAGALLIVVKHHSNIRRMLAGTEPRFHLTKSQ
jgi:glycerol-3-phosphate acyltransferase PlsY